MQNTKTDEELKQIVRETYTDVAGQTLEQNQTSCCGAGECGDSTLNIFSEDYSRMEGYDPDADLGVGCGIPTQFSNIQPGQTVVDLGSGAGNDVFVARATVGDAGKVIGIDMTDAMIEKARLNNDRLGYNNVEFRKGEIENIPIAQDNVDVVVSNCVLNLVPNKQKAFSEIFRILKPGGHFCISDVVLSHQLPPELQGAAEMYAGCVSGASLKSDYLKTILGTGFTDIQILSRKNIVIPDNILAQHLSSEQIAALKEKPETIQSLTVSAVKKDLNACDPNSGCC